MNICVGSIDQYQGTRHRWTKIRLRLWTLELWTYRGQHLMNHSRMKKNTFFFMVSVGTSTNTLAKSKNGGHMFSCQFHGSVVMLGFQILGLFFFWTWMYYEYILWCNMCSPAFSFCSKIPKTYDRVPSVCFRVDHDHHSDETGLMRRYSFDAYIQHFSCCVVLFVFRLIPRGNHKNVPCFGTIFANASMTTLSMIIKVIMTSSNGNIFRITGHMCRELTGHRWIPLTKASGTELWCFLWSTPE